MSQVKTKTTGGGVGEPWLSAEATLEKYSTLVRGTKTVEDTGRICEQYAPILKQVAMRLPKSSVPQIMGRAAEEAVIPRGRQAMAKNLMVSLHPSCRAEVFLAPEDLKPVAQQLAWLVGAESVAMEVAELLSGAPDWRTVQMADWSVAESLERLNNFLHELCATLNFITQQMNNTTKQLEGLRDFSRFFMELSLQIAGNGDLMCSMLGHEDPIYSPSTRLKHSARALWSAATGLNESLIVILRKIDIAFEDGLNGTKKHRQHVNRNNGPRSIIGMLATGNKNMMLPEEFTRRRNLDEKLRRRRLRGHDMPSDEDVPEVNRVKKNPPLENSPMQKQKDRWQQRQGGGRSRGQRDDFDDYDDEKRGSEEFDAHGGQTPRKNQLAPQFLGDNYVDSGSEDFDSPPKDMKHRQRNGNMNF